MHALMLDSLTILQIWRLHYILQVLPTLSQLAACSSMQIAQVNGVDSNGRTQLQQRPGRMPQSSLITCCLLQVAINLDWIIVTTACISWDEIEQ